MSDPLDRLRKALADRYTIERELGRGGMAVVYLAKDVKHERQVALKVLRPELAAALGPERFLQEIKIAANLHHPHILPLYDSGEAEGLLYYVMPHVEGESLRDRLEREKQLAIDDALQVAREVADALSYAHSHGVIHRDIKPENILLESGHAVVADFGIARAVDAAGGERLTATGVALGTPAYMSPEQAGGEKELDGRSDLYSLGCVLYEMLAGEPPFTGPSVEALVRQHLTAEPPNVTAIRPSVPGWVAAALERSLAKTPADRFNPVAQFGEAISPRASVTATDARPLSAAPGRRRWLAPGVIVAALVVVIAVVLYGKVRPEPLSITTSNAVRVTSEPGLEWQPAVSPDGSQVAFVADRGGRQSVVIKGTRNIAGGGELAPTQGLDEAADWFPTWSSDGETVRFWHCPGRTLSVEGCSWKEVARLGGSVRSMDLPRNAWNCSLSPSGSRWVCGASPDSIITYSISDSRVSSVVVHPDAQWGGPHSPVWSPDERWIAYVLANSGWRSDFNVDVSSIWVVKAQGGEPIRVTGDDHMDTSPVWLDDNHLLFVSNREGLREVYVAELGPTGPRGEPRKVPGATDAHWISYSIAGRKLAFAKATVRQNIWSYPTGLGPQSIGSGHTVTSENAAIESHDISPDGEWIVYDSDLRGSQDIYKMPLEGGSPTPITDSPLDDWAPRWSPDGSEIAFVRDLGSGEWAVMVAPADGGAAVQVASDAVVWLPAWSPSGLDIAYWKAPDRTEVWVSSREAVGAPWGEPVRLTDFACMPLDWARDGRGVLCQAGSELLLVSREGEALWCYDLAAAGLQGGYVTRFSWDGSMIYRYGGRDDGSRGMWAIPVQGGEPSLVVAFDHPDIQGSSRYFSVAPDRLYLTVRESESDIWVADVEVER